MGPVSDLAAGMGWSIYFMLGIVALVIGAIVLMIIRSDTKRSPRPVLENDAKRKPPP